MGCFEATISQAVGRFLWGIDLGSKTDAVVLLTEDGTGQQLETIEAKFDGANFILKDTNFQLSRPKINIKLFNPPEAKVAANATPVAKSKVITLNCIKGKTVKVIKRSEPTCPKGYLKKREQERH